MKQLLLVTWNNILSTFTVILPPLLYIFLTIFVIIVDLLCLQYRSLLILPTFLLTPLTYIYLPGLTFIVLKSTIKNIQPATLMWMPFCAKWLIITALQFKSPSHQILSTCFSLLSPSTAYYFTHLHSGLTMDLPLGISFSLRCTLPLSSRYHYQFLLIVFILGYNWKCPQVDYLLTSTIDQSEALLPASLWPSVPIST